MEWAIVLSVFSLIISLAAAGLAAYAVILTLAVQKSTHRVQFVPAEPDMKTGEDLVDEFSEALYGVKREKKKNMVIEE